MTYRDSRDLAITAGSAASASRYDDLVDRVARYDSDPLGPLEAALAHDPEFVSAHCVRAAIGVMGAERGAEPLIVQSLDAARALEGRANDRERRHFGAAEAWLHGDFHQAADLYGKIALDYPRDLLALQVAHVCDFYLGRQRMLRDRLAQARASWTEGLPGYGYSLGMLAFGLEETNLFDHAEQAARQALELERRDVWALHALAHVHEMRGEVTAGIDLLRSRLPDWATDNAFAFHNFWHLALFLLEHGDGAGVLEIFDRRLAPQPSTLALELVDAASLLYRLSLRGVPVGSRAAAVADAWSDPALHGYYGFNDWHAVMAFLTDGRHSEARRLIAELERRAADDSSNGQMTREVALPLSRAMLAFAEARYGEVVDTLLPLRLTAHGFGGSNAQRDVIEQVLSEAALRAGRAGLVRALVAERRLLRPRNTWAWRLELRLEVQAGRNAAA